MSLRAIRRETFYFRDMALDLQGRKKGLSLIESDHMILDFFTPSLYPVLRPHYGVTEHIALTIGTGGSLYQGTDVVGDETLSVFTSGDTVYKFDPDTAETYFSLKTSVGNYAFGIADMDAKLFFFNGSVTPWKATIDASPTVTNIGLTRLDVSSSASARSGAGNVKGTVRYYVSDVDDTSGSVVESALSAAFGEIDARDGSTIALTSLPMFTSALRIYRSTANGAQPYYLATITSGSTYNDNTADSGLGDLPFAHGDPPPSEARPCVVHYNRLFIAYGNRLAWSDLSQPESFWVVESIGNWADVQGDDGDKIVALAKEPQGIVVFKRNHIYRLIGRNPEDFQLVEVTLPDPLGRAGGCNDFRALTSVGNALAVGYGPHIYLYAGGSLARISDPIVGAAIENRGVSSYEVNALGYWSEVGQLYAQLGGRTWVYNVAQRRWVGYFSGSIGAPIRAFADIQAQYKRRFFMLSSTGLYKFDAEDFSSYFEFPGSIGFELSDYDGGAPDLLKRFLYVDVHSLVDTDATPSSLALSVQVDGFTKSLGSLSMGEEGASQASGAVQVRRVWIDQLGHTQRLSGVVTKGTSGMHPSLVALTFGTQAYPGPADAYAA